MLQPRPSIHPRTVRHLCGNCGHPVPIGTEIRCYHPNRTVTLCEHCVDCDRDCADVHRRVHLIELQEQEV
ncbi:hypothetical protein LCGC14_0312970 [marine sediment metagenome]|uniref:Uncharacterized protein n=1 Tax=marine sediment metagenome TaxID=412755 RepID=A0A0F9TLK0_9ZZZZ